MEKDSEYWRKKRLEVIPVPKLTGESVNRSEEEHKKAREDLIRLMKESGVDTTGLQ